MIKRNSLTAFFCAFIVFSMTCPSVAYTIFPGDSIRVKWMEGKKYILHKVEPKETWQHLSRRYHCTLADLKTANEGVEQLKIGQIINIPSPGASTTASFADPKVMDKAVPVKEIETASKNESLQVSFAGTPNKNTPILYKVKKGDTMYGISKKFNQKIEDIKSANKLTSDILSEGQVLTVGYQNTAIVSTPSQEKSSLPGNTVKEEKQAVLTSGSKVEPVERYTAGTGVSPASGFDKPTKSISPVKKGNSGKTLMQVTETGVATWIREGQVNSDKYYALHRSAPIGTIVKVTNRMNNQFVYVKVVGSLPDTGDNENIIIKVSQAVSSKLVALDPLFQVELSYGMMN